MDRKLLDYLPPVLREVLEFQAINAANEPEISIAWDALALVLANQFLDTATASGVAAWERELNIRPKDTDTLEVRKARIKALWNLELPYTLPWLKNWLTGLCGELGHEESIVDYTINIQLDYTVLPDADALAAEILDMLLMVRPANEPHPVKRTEKKYKVFPASSHSLLAVFYAARQSACFSIGVSTPRLRWTRLVL